MNPFDEYEYALGELVYMLTVLIQEVNPKIKSAPTMDLLDKFFREIDSKGVRKKDAKKIGRKILETAKWAKEDERTH